MWSLGVQIFYYFAVILFIYFYFYLNFELLCEKSSNDVDGQSHSFDHHLLTELIMRLNRPKFHSKQVDFFHTHWHRSIQLSPIKP